MAANRDSRGRPGGRRAGCPHPAEPCGSARSNFEITKVRRAKSPALPCNRKRQPEGKWVVFPQAAVPHRGQGCILAKAVLCWNKRDASLQRCVWHESDDQLQRIRLPLAHQGRRDGGPGGRGELPPRRGRLPCNFPGLRGRPADGRRFPRAPARAGKQHLELLSVPLFKRAAKPPVHLRLPFPVALQGGRFCPPYFRKFKKACSDGHFLKSAVRRGQGPALSGKANALPPGNDRLFRQSNRPCTPFGAHGLFFHFAPLRSGPGLLKKGGRLPRRQSFRFFIPLYSYRSASMGSSLAALLAG